MLIIDREASLLIPSRFDVFDVLRCDLDLVDVNDSLESIEKFDISEPASDIYASVLSLSSPLYSVLVNG